jgi:predicted NUDIX family phosphoesterase
VTHGGTVTPPQVLVVDRAALFGGHWPQGFTALPGPAGQRLLATGLAQARFEPRAVAEQTTAWKQWIPYCVLRRLAADGSVEAVFWVTRLPKQGEQRLHGLRSIGLGGHVDPEDGLPDATQPGAGPAYFARALWRELHEELVLDLPPHLAPRFLGLLVDDSTPVGQVHAGLVYVLDLPTASPAPAGVQIREISKMAGTWGSLVELRELWQDRARFETWTQLLIEAGIAGAIGGSEFAVGDPGFGA